MSKRVKNQKPSSEEDRDLKEVGRKFHDLEDLFSGCGESCDESTLTCLNRIVASADEILDLVHLHNLGNTGIIQSQTSLYLSLTLNRRGNCYWRFGFLLEKNTREYCQKAIEDYNRSEQLSLNWDFPVTILPQRRCQCYLELDMFDQAINEAQRMCNLRRDSDNFMLLSHCYRKIRDYHKALEAATEAIKCAHNNDARFHAWRNRGAIYEEMDQAELANKDYQTAQGYKGRL